MEHEITEPGPLLDSVGRLREPGWARRLLLAYDRSAIKVPAWRIKEWDYYCVICGNVGLALTMADNGYMGMLSASILDFAAGTESTGSAMRAFPMGRTALPSSSASGISEASYGGAHLRFEAADGVRRLSFSWPDFNGKAAPPRRPGRAAIPPDGETARREVGLEGELILREQAPRESMVIATPFPRAPRSFYYNQKINCLEAEGVFRFGGREYRCEKGSAFAVLDWGRGVWTYANTWYWGSASGSILDRSRNSANGLAGGASFGFNIGYGFGDTSAASENMIFYEGKAHKLGRLAIEFDHDDFLAPWRARSEDGRFNMTLSPILDRAATTNLGLLASIQHQVFGDWSGRAVLDDGREILVERLRGFCEKVVNRW
jgi:hypothetical protein